MDTSDRSSGALSPWSPSSTALTPQPAAWDDSSREASSSSKPFNVRIVLRAIRRHWWQILAIWLVGSAGLVYFAYTKIKPIYDVYSYIEVSPPPRALLSAGTTGTETFRAYMDTQVLLINSIDVISEAIRDPNIAKLPKVWNSLDPENEIRKEIGVSIPQRGTNLIMVRMADTSADQAAAIVNAVVAKYIIKAKDWTDSAAQEQIKTLTDLKKVYENEVKVQRDLVKTMYKNAMESPGEPAAKPGGEESGKPAPLAGRYQMTLEEVHNLQKELAEAKIAKVQAEAAVNTLQKELRERPPAAVAAEVPPTGKDLEARITDEFHSLPAVAQIAEEITDLENQYDVAVKRIRNHQIDPAAKKVKRDLDSAKDRYKQLWERSYNPLKARIQGIGTGSQVDLVAQSRLTELRESQHELQSARIREKLLEDQIQKVRIEAKSANSDSVDVQFAKDDLDYTSELLATTSRQLEQLEYEEMSGTKITPRLQARPPRQPTSDNRMKVAAAGPLGMLFLAVALFVLIEFRSARVADPDELSHRARLGVIGVVPPLPSLGSSRRALSVRGQRDEKRRIEEFVQSLDQLRVTLCAHRPGMSHRRCVLITSATGGEGKTTLAAQLAGRCANAGLMTLLIDADLRRPSLGDLLEVPEGPGLVDVLSGDASPESAMVVIGNAGGFHLLPAGTMGQDPSRLLHGDRLGQLIAQFRETFDIVIIDAPPVLAVPDALLLGRWADGAVLAVRHDTSRFPLVERANKRLTSVGVNVLGAVINGCRTMESSYGSYRYTPYAAADATGGAGGTSPQDV